MPLGALDELKLRSQFYFRAYDKCSLGVEKYVPCGNRRLWISPWDCAPHQVTRMLSIRGAPPPLVPNSRSILLFRIQDVARDGT